MMRYEVDAKGLSGVTLPTGSCLFCISNFAKWISTNMTYCREPLITNVMWRNIFSQVNFSSSSYFCSPFDSSFIERCVWWTSFLVIQFWQFLASCDEQAIYQIAVLLALNFGGNKILGLSGTTAENDALRNTIIFNAFVYCQVCNSLQSILNNGLIGHLETHDCGLTWDKMLVATSRWQGPTFSF